MKCLRFKQDTLKGKKCCLFYESDKEKIKIQQILTESVSASKTKVFKMLLDNCILYVVRIYKIQ